MNLLELPIDGLAKRELHRQQAQKKEQARQATLVKQQKEQQLKIQQTIQTLLTKAANDIKRMRLSSPKNNNAVDKYQQILQLEPSNQKAQQGLTEIVEKYLQLAENAQEKNQFKKAKQQIAKAKNIQAQNQNVSKAEDELKRVEKTYREEQLKLVEEKRLKRQRELAKSEAEERLKRSRTIDERNAREVRIRVQRELRDAQALISRKEKVAKAALKNFIVAKGSVEYKARHILVKTRDEAKKVITELNAGAKFEALARSKSAGPSGAKGGDLGWFSLDRMVPLFSEAVIALENGKYTTTPVQTQFGWHVILREQSREKAPPAFELDQGKVKH